MTLNSLNYRNGLKLKSVIFDFDGIILESVSAKTKAFRALFAHENEHLEEIIKVHVNNGGMSRYREFDIIYKDILKKPLSEKESKELGQKFSDLCYREVVRSPFVPGADIFLKKYYQTLKFFVISGTPEEELISVVNERSLDQYFKGVYGSPRLKGDLAKMILTENNLVSDEVVFIGDSSNDQEGAAAAGVRFIGRIYDDVPNPFRNLLPEDTITDLTQLEHALMLKG